jgi:Tol biopolymer transport system component/serine/threonine protein kinase
MIGQTLGHYKILEQLGAGGMGVVYKALDTHLDRFVAIKVLPPEKVSDPERKRRFVQEAKAASALNHPNIITIYDITSDGGTDFMAMEYVSGKALNDLIVRKGMPLSDSLKYAVQIADALATAHAAGIIHRDLKPGNVMVAGGTEQGRPGFVKVLDFGLAKLSDKIESTDAEVTKTNWHDDAPSTGEGTIVGTVSYMSPEQAEGRKVDARTDIFSFGALLYEMVTGRRAFRGDSKLSTLSAILREDPKPASQVVEGLPRELERIIGRCLRKSPERRFQTMADLKVALEELKEESDSGTLATGPAPVRPRRGWLPWAAALLAIMGLGGGILWFVRPAPKTPEPALTATPLTAYPGYEGEPSFSPDGNQVAFTWNGEKRDNFDIYVKLIGTGGPPLRLTTDPARDYGPAWSPDGRFIAFLRELSREKSAVLLIPALGGPELRVAEVFTSDFVSGPYLAWSPDGSSLVITDTSSPREPMALFLLAVDTGEKHRLTSPPAQLHGDSTPAFSPDGRTLAFSRSGDFGTGDLYLLTFSDGLKPVGEAKRITFGNRGAHGPTWTEDGRDIVFRPAYFGQNDLWRIAASASGGRSTEPQQLASLGGDNDGPVISRRGHRLAYRHFFRHTSIWRIAAPGRPSAEDIKSPRSLKRATPIISSTRDDLAPQFSPDGKKIAFMSTRSGRPEIWVCDGDGSNAVQLTSFGGPQVTNPRWSPDGERIAFDSNAGGQFDIWVTSASGGKPQRMTTDPANDGNPSWSRDGRWIYFDSARTGEQQVWKIPAAGGDAIQVTRDGGFAPLESRDGRFLYYAKALESTSLWRVPAEGGQATKLVDSLSTHLNLAIVDGGIYFVPTQDTGSGSSIRFLDFTTNQIKPVASFEKPLSAGEQGGLAFSPDGRWILCTQVDQAGSELILVENFR